MFLYHFLRRLKRKNSTTGCTIVNKGVARIKKDIIGCNNIICIGSKTVLHNTHIRIRGNNNKIYFEEGCMVGPKCSFWMVAHFTAKKQRYYINEFTIVNPL